MGDIADDAYDAEMLAKDIADRMKSSGCKPCPNDHESYTTTCPLCHDLGWIDANGNPCEP